MSYDDGSPLAGVPSDVLVRESARAGQTGAVGAYRDTSGVWQYVPDAAKSQYERHLGLTVTTVYIEP